MSVFLTDNGICCTCTRATLLFIPTRSCPLLILCSRSCALPNDGADLPCPSLLALRRHGYLNVFMVSKILIIFYKKLKNVSCEYDRLKLNFASCLHLHNVV